VQNEPNFARRNGHRRPNAQNEPNFPAAPAADRGKYAKRSQTWGDWSVWAKAVVVPAVALPGAETCKTNPICLAGAGKFEIRTTKSEANSSSE
jgi:hypothetical protein